MGKDLTMLIAMLAASSGPTVRGDPKWWGSQESKGISREEREKRKAKKKIAKRSQRRNR